MNSQSNRDTILIVRNAHGEMSMERVRARLKYLGYKVLELRNDKITEGTQGFSLGIDSDLGFVFELDGTRIYIEKIAAAWLERTFIGFGNRNRFHQQRSNNSERVALLNGVWNCIPNKFWLNSLDSLDKSERKILQLKTAKELGFNIPPTVISNDWDAVKNLPDKELIFKTHNPIFLHEDSIKVAYTTKVKKSELINHTKTLPFPGIWQSFVNKKHEWRITAVGNQTFDAKIVIAEKAKHDWRKHQKDTEAVKFEKCALPKSVQKLCIKYLKAFNLKYGAFDLVEDENGEIFFLECNPGGAYGWLEHQLDLPISKAIADELHKIAQDSK